MPKVVCYTLFDITPTGVLNHTRATQLPFTSAGGIEIRDEESLGIARNQQRNWETFLQIIGLRAQPTVHKNPALLEDASLALFSFRRSASRIWSFEFSAEQVDVYDANGQALEALIRDCDGIPMITGLHETRGLENVVQTRGEKINTVFLYVNE